LDGALVGRERLAPEKVEFRAEGFEPGGIDAVDALLAGRRIDDQPGILENLQMLRNRRAADGQAPRQLADRAGVLRQPLEYRAPGGVGEGGPSVVRVSHG